jgi:hypothetical protein
MKFATHILLFNQDKWIIQNIENSGHFVDKIYISWSDKPWNYNKNARNDFKNNTNLDILKKSKYYDKIVIIKGVWDTEHEQRNACVDMAIKDGIDYLITHDADEFYTYDDFNKLLNDIKKNPDFDYYTTPWVTFWKDLNNIMFRENGETIMGHPEIAINLNRNVRFVSLRKPSGNKVKQLNSLCYHASYVLSDDECWSKINTWGHSHQFNTKSWFDNKWLNWKPGDTCMHPITPCLWYGTKYFDKSELPEVLNTK